MISVLYLVSEGENAGFVPISPPNIQELFHSEENSPRSSAGYFLSDSMSASDSSLFSGQNIDRIKNEMEEPKGNHFIIF